MSPSQSTPYDAERLSAEATGDFYCEGEQVRSSLKCQRPCDDCWKRHGWTNTPKVPEGPLTREEVLDVAGALFQHYGWNNPGDVTMRNRIQRMRDMALATFAESEIASKGASCDSILGQPGSGPVTQAEIGSAIGDIAAERKRQIEVEWWDAEHDDHHDNGGLALAAACYASLAAVSASERLPLDLYAKAESPFRWPWERKWWKPKNPRRDLVRAAALIVAEIERIDRRGK